MKINIMDKKSINFQSLSDSGKIRLLNDMIKEYKDSPKIIKVLKELKSGIEEYIVKNRDRRV